MKRKVGFISKRFLWRLFWEREVLRFILFKIINLVGYDINKYIKYNFKYRYLDFIEYIK